MRLISAKMLIDKGIFLKIWAYKQCDYTFGSPCTSCAEWCMCYSEL